MASRESRTGPEAAEAVASTSGLLAVGQGAVEGDQPPPSKKARPSRATSSSKHTKKTTTKPQATNEAGPSGASRQAVSSASSSHHDAVSAAPLVSPGPQLAPIHIEAQQGPFSPPLAIATSSMWGPAASAPPPRMADTGLPPSTSGAVSSMWAPAPSVSRPRVVEATFTPTAAGLRPEAEWAGGPTAPIPGNQWPHPMPGVQDYVAEALRQGFAAGIRAQPPTRAAPNPVIPPVLAAEDPESEGEESPALSEEGEVRDPDFSEDESQPRDKPGPKGVFPPELFSSLLAKARAASGPAPPVIPEAAAATAQASHVS